MARLLLIAPLLLGVCLPPAWAQPGSVVRFVFGTPESVTHPGFTKVTVQDAFTPQKGYGFQTTDGLVAYDRGGARVERPQDDYTASAYGAFRTTSDLTCALIEGARDNAFLVALPDGRYTVWLIACDAEWDPPLFEVWANGQRKLDVRIPRRTYVFMEPFQASATGGVLRIELRGRHGWILSSLIIGQNGPELDAAVASAHRHIFFLTDEELPNWKERPLTSPNPPLALTPSEKRRGYVVFPADYTELVTPAYAPLRATVNQPLATFATPGEVEPATFCVLADRDLGAVSVQMSDWVGERPGQRISRRQVSVGVVRCRPVRLTGEGPRGEFGVAPDRIDPPTARTARVAAGQTKQWWLTLRVPPGATPGRYRTTLTVRPEKAPATTLEWRLLVLPFRLTRPKDRHWATWLESFPPVGGLRGPETRGRNTPAEMDRLARADLTNYRDHGFDLALFNYYFGVKENPDGSFAYDLSALIRDMEYWKRVGSCAPVVICCEYAFRDLEYRFAEGDRHVPGTFSPKARRAIIGLVQSIRDEARRRNWPKIYFAPIDEPGNSKTENRMLFAENVLDMVHAVPGCQTATTITAADLQRLGNRVDVPIYAYGHYNRNKVLREAREGRPFWFYDNGMFYGHSTLASRGLPGFEFLRSGAQVAAAWGFDCTYGNPDNDFDSGHRDWNVVFLGVDGVVPTIYWELCREGVDDCRYVATLEEAIRRARAQGRTAAARRAEQVLAPLVHPGAPSIANPLAFGRLRWRLAREILALAGRQRDSRFGPPLRFWPIVRNQGAPIRLGPNVIADPSFEAGPQADGFPTPGYYIADPYSKPEAKPIGALAVTDEVAHTGRFSLKWDVREAEGKGFLYGRDRWLIVNVQVPREQALALRGKRVRVGLWFRLGAGACAPGFSLRQFGRGEFLGGIPYTGGIEDPAVWNHFVTEGRLRTDFEGLDIHIHCRVPDDPQVARQAFFYIDDVSLQAIEEPVLSLSTPLDEYYVGEAITWSAAVQPAALPSTPAAAASARRVEVDLLLGARTIARQVRPLRSASSTGAFTTRGLEPGLYTLQATFRDRQGITRRARQSVILSPNPFAW